MLIDKKADQQLELQEWNRFLLKMKRDQMPQKKNSLIKLSSKEDAQGS